jgi:hypothetical protein
MRTHVRSTRAGVVGDSGDDVGHLLDHSELLVAIEYSDGVRMWTPAEPKFSTSVHWRSHFRQTATVPSPYVAVTV